MRGRYIWNRQNKAGPGKVATGLVLGSIVGATIGLLMAPASGEETRRKIKGKVKGVQMRVKDTAGSIEEQSLELIGEARDGFDGIRESIAERVTGRKKSASS